MDISNEELFAHAMGDDQQAETNVTEQSATETQGQPRDEQGRFAEKPEQIEKPETQAKPENRDEGQIPSWRLREIREERDELRRQLAMFQRQPAQQPQQKPAKPDMFEKPDEFVRMSVQEGVDPVVAEVARIREDFSRVYAIDKYGEEKVSEAYAALDRSAKAGDPEAVATVARVKQSSMPFQDIMRWHEKQSVYSQIGNDPNAWFEKELERRLADEKFKGALAAKMQPPREEKSKPVFNVPSLNRVASAAPSLEEGGDFSNESLFKFAMS